MKKLTKRLLVFLLIVCAGILVLFLFVSNSNVYTLDSQNESVESRATLVFVGDMMFDRYVRKKAVERGSYSSVVSTDLQNIIRGADIAVGNLEGPITSHTSVSMDSVIASPDNYRFTFDPRVTEVLSEIGFDAVSLANNHIFNFGYEGAEETERYLESAGVEYFGSPLGKNSSSILEVEGMQVALVGYNWFGVPGFNEALEGVRELQDADFVVVFAHWGEEYEAVPSEAVRSVARSFVDAGADLVVGSHTHVVGEVEEYQGVPIYYSLGNFIFDQYWIDDVRCGMLLQVEVVKRGEETRIGNTSHVATYLEKDGTVRKVVDECGM